MKKNKSAHCVMRNEKFFCSHCGQSQDLVYPMEIPKFAEMADAFSKAHANCAPVWTQPFPDPALSIEERMKFWLEFGEHGISSRTMFAVISGRQIIPVKDYGHPHDPNDLRRCYELLKMIPEWKSTANLDKMYISKVWTHLVDNWDKLMELLEEQINGKSNDLYKLMKDLGC